MSAGEGRAEHTAEDDDLAVWRAEALAGGRKPRRRGIWYTTEHTLRAMRAYGWTIVVGSLGQPVLYLLGLGLGLAALLQEPIVDGDLAVSYVAFVAPALLMTAALSVATEEFTYPVMAGFKWRRHFYGFGASPLSPSQIAGGVVIGATVRMVLTVTLYFAFIWLFASLLPDVFGTALHPATAWLSIAVGIVAGLAFGMPLMAYAASIQDDKGQIALVQRFVFMPMFLFSGTFYPLSSLPDWLEWVGWISPLWHASELGRMAMYRPEAPVAAVVLHVGYLLVLVVVGWIATRALFARRLAR